MNTIPVCVNDERSINRLMKEQLSIQSAITSLKTRKEGLRSLVASRVLDANFDYDSQLLDLEKDIFGLNEKSTHM